jgi:hypothetical protein
MDKFFTVFGKIILLLLIVSGAGYLAYRYTTPPAPTTNQAVLTGTITTAPSETITPSPVQSSQTVTAGLNFAGGISFPAYTITIPADWTVTHTNNPGESPSDYLTVSKGSYQFKIMQGATGGAMCLYPGEPDQEGPSSRYTSFVEFTGTNTNIFRRGTSPAPSGYASGYTVCMKNGNDASYGQPTGFGHISYGAPASPDPSILTQMDTMIASLKTK